MIISHVHGVTEHDIGAYAWHRLRLYRNPDFTTAHLMKLHQVPSHHRKNVESQSNEIRFCLIQAEEYLTSASRASLATRPVLMYYGLMSLALAEILVKKSGNHRLAKLREAHASHGLTLQVLGSIDQSARLPDIVERLASQVQRRKGGVPYGTFDVWRSEVRECPVPALATTVYANGGKSTGVRAMFTGQDQPPPLTNNDCYSFVDAIKALPQFHSLLDQLEIGPLTVRAAMTTEVNTDGDGKLTLVVHPASDEALNKLYNSLVVSADAVNTMQITELPSGLILNVPLQKWRLPHYLSLPPTIATTASGVSFVTHGWHLGEFGSYYVALHICGNLARYYPDVWMQHVERSTNFALLVEEICQLALTRLPILTAGEIDRRYYVAN